MYYADCLTTPYKKRLQFDEAPRPGTQIENSRLLSQTGGQFSFTLDQPEKRCYLSGPEAPCNQRTSGQEDTEEYECGVVTKPLTPADAKPARLISTISGPLAAARSALGRPLIGLRDVPMELSMLRSRSAYQALSGRPPLGFAPIGRLAR